MNHYKLAEFNFFLLSLILFTEIIQYFSYEITIIP